MTEQEYCSQVCGAKCCAIWMGKSICAFCPQLKADRTCRDYENRLGFEFAIRLPHRFVIGKCSMVKDITLPKHIEDQCCVYHPELLDAKGQA